MIRPILACQNPYETAELFHAVGWHIDFSQPPESGDPLVGVSLLGNSVLLGVTEGYVPAEQMSAVGCGVEIYMTIPQARMEAVYTDHAPLCPTALGRQPWGDTAFEVTIGGFQFMIAAE